MHSVDVIKKRRFLSERRLFINVLAKGDIRGLTVSLNGDIYLIDFKCELFQSVELLLSGDTLFRPGGKKAEYSPSRDGNLLIIKQF